MNGLLIALEGIDGSGKSTLARALVEQLNQRGITTLLTKEPGGTALGVHIRQILQHREYPIDPKSEFLLFAADRAQHFQHFIIPQLQAGAVIISDRMADSAMVYQGFGRGLDRTMIASINSWAMQGMKPDLTVYVRIDLPTARARMSHRASATEKLSSFDTEQDKFFQKLIDGFETLYHNRTDVMIVDGSQTVETLASETLQRITQWMQTNQPR
jgi:dTMP kinase